MKNNGDVGIGTESPSARLDIVGELDGHNNLINLQQGYAIFSDNQGCLGASSGGTTRLWIDGPNNGSIVLGPRSGDRYLEMLRVRVRKSRFEGDVFTYGKLWVRDEILVQSTNPWADFVFDDDYNLMPLQAIEDYIKSNKHLPEIPSASEVEKNGINLGEMDAKLLQKIEELMLYTIEQQKQIDALKEEIKLIKQ